MSIARTTVFLVGLLLAATVVGAAEPAVVGGLVGSWEGKGELFGQPATFSMRWSRALGDTFVRLEFENRLIKDDATQQTVLEAIALYRVGGDGGANALSGTWFDSRGQTVTLEATATADTLTTHWTAATEQGRTTYRAVDAGAVEVEDQVLGEDGWRSFATARYVRVAEQPAARKGTQTMRATGSFEVKLVPMETYNQSPDAELARMSIDKTFEGDLKATSQGEMLSGGLPAEGHAGYVAIECVTGILHGKRGSFLLQHSGTMTPDSQSLTVTVIPGSGTGELEGVEGTLGIDIRDGQHHYWLEYTLPAQVD